MPSNPSTEMLQQTHTHSFGSLDYEGHQWACYLVTYRTSHRRWCGYLAFEPREGSAGVEELNGEAAVRTADLFIESDPGEIERRARSLGRPLLAGLLASAQEVKTTSGARLRGWVETALEHRSTDGVRRDELSTAEAPLRSQYATYRLDQLAHLVSLINDDDLEALVDTLLDAEPYAFRSQDRLQFAMLVVQKLEPLLPLPPYEVFAADYGAREAEYERYHHDLHSGGGVADL